jgi:hypothetical protein
MMIMITKMMTVIEMNHNYFRVGKTAFGSIINSARILSSRQIDTKNKSQLKLFDVKNSFLGKYLYI